MAVATTASPPEWKKIQEGFADKGLQHVFLELLGWGLGNAKVLPCEVDGEAFAPTVVADLKGYRVFLVEKNTLPSPKLQARIDGALAVQAPERITIFSDGTTMQWRWPHQTPSGGVSYESLTISASKMPSFLAQRLVGLKFSAQDFAAGVSLVDVRDRVRGRFDGAKVTKKFFDEFRKHHQHLASSIEGIDLDDNRSTYATLLMNRLMLLYFLQKREFLNDDPFYLENCLKKVQQSRGENKFYSFYRDLLLPMFFDRLAAFAPKELDPDVALIIGDIPYINGGIYEPSALEKELGPALNVPDEVFEIVLNFFGKFNWHLDTRPSGSENEINPEVIGYIFEQYINYTAGGKKDNGAYYTKEDVTGYMVGATLVPRILDYLVELSIPCLDLVAHDPRRYIHADMLHGYDPVTQSWVAAPDRLEEVWADDPIHWHELDEAGHNTDINLAGESWVETFYRRERVEKLAEELSTGLASEVNDVITHNLNSRLLLTDAISRIDDENLAFALWGKVTSLSVLDPTCGSGAFLFAAMEALEDVYHHLIDVMRTEQSDRGAAHDIVKSIERHPNDRYFVRKSIALNNLYGTDLMPDAIETAKLRIFLALVSCLETKVEIEPLPDLDFNLKCGNLLVGLKDPGDLDRLGADLVSKLSIQELEPNLVAYETVLGDFIAKSKEADPTDLGQLRGRLLALGAQLRVEANEIFSPLGGAIGQPSQDWVSEHRPFHWFIEFPIVLRHGGFDVVVGNPPYIAKSSLSKEALRQISTYETHATPDIYAVCSERALSLLQPGAGRFGFVVMSNSAFAQAFSRFRKLYLSPQRAQWWSTYGRIPDGLFSPARVRNAIIIAAAGASFHVSRHHIFTSANRKSLFSSLEYCPSELGSERRVVRHGHLSELAKTLAEHNHPVSGAPKNDVKIFVKPTAAYWFPVMPGPTPSLDEALNVIEPIDSLLKPLELLETEDWRIVTCLLAGKIQYFWSSAIGDDFHVNTGETFAVRNLAVHAELAGKKSLQDLAAKIIARVPEALILVSNKGLRVNIRWSDLRAATDLFDREVLGLLGLTDEWRNLNVWYRSSMRSSGASGKGRPLAPGHAPALLRFPS